MTFIEILKTDKNLTARKIQKKYETKEIVEFLNEILEKRYSELKKEGIFQDNFLKLISFYYTLEDLFPNFKFNINKNLLKKLRELYESD